MARVALRPSCSSPGRQVGGVLPFILFSSFPLSFSRTFLPNLHLSFFPTILCLLLSFLLFILLYFLPCKFLSFLCTLFTYIHYLLSSFLSSCYPCILPSFQDSILPTFLHSVDRPFFPPTLPYASFLSSIFLFFLSFIGSSLVPRVSNSACLTSTTLLLRYHF